MNKKQKTCLLIGIAAIVVMGLYPPWVIQSERNFVGGSIRNQIVKRYEYKTEAGPYSWIDEPPAKAKFVDLYRLGVQFFVVAVVTAGLVITFRDEKATKQ